MENFDYGEMDFSDLIVDLPKPIGAKRNHSDMVTTDDEDFDFGEMVKRHQTTKPNEQQDLLDAAEAACLAATQTRPPAVTPPPPPPPPPPTPAPVAQPKSTHPMNKGKLQFLLRFS